MDEEYPSVHMERPRKILRKSIHKFLQNYHYFTVTAALLALPFSVTILFTQAAVPSLPLLPTVLSRLQSLFQAAGFPPSLRFFSILNIKISQTICCYILTLPFSLSFLLLAKAAVVLVLRKDKSSGSPSFTSFVSIYSPLLFTQICNYFVILSANATVFSILFLAFNSFDAFGFSSPNFLLFLSAAGAVLYSVVFAQAVVTCNFAFVVAGMENCSGYLAILRASVLIRGKTSTALFLALPLNFSLAALEALFHYRVVRAYYFSHEVTSSMALEAMLIAYLYSLLILIDCITTSMFYKSCKSSSLVDGEAYSTELGFQRNKVMSSSQAQMLYMNFLEMLVVAKGDIGPMRSFLQEKDYTLEEIKTGESEY